MQSCYDLQASKLSPAASFNAGEFEVVKDRSVKPASSYNWDQAAPSSAPSVDPDSDDFFSSMLADDNKVLLVVSGGGVVPLRHLRHVPPPRQ